MGRSPILLHVSHGTSKRLPFYTASRNGAPTENPGKPQAIRHKTGCGITPLGWLCIKIRAAALFEMAPEKTTNGETSKVSSVPWQRF
jgi:hypothetical protein